MFAQLCRLGRIPAGGCLPRDLAFAVLLGTLAGFVAGWNYSLVAVLLLAILLGVNLRCFVAAWATSLAVGWLSEPITWRLGSWLLEQTPAGALVACLGDGVLVALLGWDQYTVAGGALLGGVLGAAAFRPTWRRAQRYRQRLSADANERGSGESASPPGPCQTTGSRLLELLAPMQAADSSYPGPLWARRLAAALLLAIVAGWLPWSLGPVLVKRELLGQLTVANRAETTAGAVRLSLWSGELEIDDLRLADPQNLDRDRLRIARVCGRLHRGALLRGRFEAETLLAEGLEVDVARQQRAQPAGGPRFHAEPSSGMARGSERSAALELDGYIRDWPLLQERLSWLGRLVSAAEQLARLDQDGSQPQRAKRSHLGRPQPRIAVDQLRADQLAAVWGLGQRATLNLSGLTSNAELTGQPTQLEIVAPELALEASCWLNLHKPGQKHQLEFRMYELPLAPIVDVQQADRYIMLAGGKATLRGKGWIDRGGLELAVGVEAERLDLHAIGPEALVDLDPRLWEAGLRRLGDLRTEVALAGTWMAPRLSVDGRRLIEHFKHQLRASGEHQLVAAVDEGLARVAAREAQEAARLATPREDEPLPDASGFFLISDSGDQRRTGIADQRPTGPVPPAAPVSKPDGVAPRYGSSEHGKREHPLRDGQWLAGDRLPAEPPLGRYPQTNAPVAASLEEGPRAQHPTWPRDEVSSQPITGMSGTASPYGTWSRSPSNPVSNAHLASRPRVPEMPGAIDMDLGTDSEPPTLPRRYRPAHPYAETPCPEPEPAPNRFTRWSRSMASRISRVFSRRSPEAIGPTESWAEETPAARIAEHDRREAQARELESLFNAPPSRPPASNPWEDESPIERQAAGEAPWYKRIWR